jgi:hypothetical protein
MPWTGRLCELIWLWSGRVGASNRWWAVGILYMHWEVLCLFASSFSPSRQAWVGQEHGVQVGIEETLG